jgi:hypothetical protein
MRNGHLVLGLIVFISTALSCANSDSKFKNVIGKEYRSLAEFKEFKDFEELGGAMIESYKNTDYGFEHLRKDSVNLIAFEKILNKAKGKPSYLLIDILEIKGLSKNQYISYGNCRIDGKPDSEIIAIYVFKDDVEFYNNVPQAWRANRKTGKIEKISTTGIDCINEGYGVD